MKFIHSTKHHGKRTFGAPAQNALKHNSKSMVPGAAGNHQNEVMFTKSGGFGGVP